jgi:hypothetical protein
MEPTKLLEPAEAPTVEQLESEHERKVEREAAEAWARIIRGNSWLDWLAIGEGLLIGRLKAMRRAGTNRPTVPAYKKAYRDWLEQPGKEWAARLMKDKSTHNAAVWCAENRNLVEQWRATLTDNVRYRQNHPCTVKKAYERVHKAAKDEADAEKGPTKVEQLEARCQELEDENMKLKAEGYLEIDPKKLKARDLARMVFESGAKWVWLTDFRVEVERLHEAAREKTKRRSAGKE